MGTNIAWKGKDDNIYVYFDTSDIGHFFKKAKPNEKTINYNPPNTKFKQEMQIQSRAKALKEWPGRVISTEGFKKSKYDQKQGGWVATNFKGKKFLIKRIGKKFVRSPLTRIRKKRRDGKIQRYWVKKRK